ncbi:hypothetical protein V865_000381 [Kwoniella europaea PYCC6329]|uniref:Major facilitator superfamily (MFS) profile domain-containing protein n=1 Tax=Kwoniella europaea PYCC6329 TaxID=1423913 RepID=A0AAX4K7M7_9TREE
MKGQQLAVCLSPHYRFLSRDGQLSGLSLPGEQNSKVEDQTSEAIHHDLARSLSKGREYALLAVFSMGLFMDVVGFSVFFVMVNSTAEDLVISTAEETWIITSYGVTFASGSHPASSIKADGSAWCLPHSLRFLTLDRRLDTRQIPWIQQTLVLRPTHHLFPTIPVVLLWERRLQDGFALIPSRTWQNPNFLLWSVLALLVYGWWAAEFVAQAETYMQVHDDLPIIAGIRLLPQGITAFSMNLILIKCPAISTKTRFAVIGGCIVSIVLFILGGARTGSDYWKYTFPASIIGSPAMQFLMNSCNVCAMMSVDPHEAGVAGAILQTSFQIGPTIALSIQSGLLTVDPNLYFDLRNIRASWYFMLGWTVVWLIVFAALYRQPREKSPAMMASH